TLRQPASAAKQARVQFEGELKKIEDTLEDLAWREAYQRAWQGAAPREAAERAFVAEFVQIRLFTIERHEGAHLLDLQNNSLKPGAKREDSFQKFTELNAFYTELANSPNPLDALTQAVAGLLDEIRQAKSVDFSLEKVTTLLDFLKRCPRFAGQFKQAHLSKSSLQALAQLKTEDFKFAGHELYQDHLLQA